MQIFKKLSKRTQDALVEVGDCWTLREGKRHIHIFVNDTFAGVVPHKCRGDGNNAARRSELNVISQIRRAARGDAVSRRQHAPA